MNQTVVPGGTDSGGRRPRIFVALGIGAVAVACIGLWLLSRPHAGAAATDNETNVPPLVTVTMANWGDVNATVSLTGLISARNDMPIGNEGDPGRIAEVLVEAGDHVRKGQLLARLNPITAESQLDGAAASLDQDRANAAAAQAEWARAERDADLFSTEESDRRRAAALTAQAKVKAAEAQVTDAHNRVAHTRIIAPTDGIVLTRTAEVGQIAVPGSTVLFHLARDGQIEMRGQVAEQDLPRLKVGQAAEVHLDGVTRVYPGKIWQLGAIIDPATRQGSVRIALGPAEQDLRSGAFARADIEVSSTRGAVLPETAVLSDEQGTYVLIVGPQDKVERRTVRISGARSDGLLVSEGLNGTERVVAIAGAFLRSGEKVRIAATAPAPERRL
jgi:RND family efflux transporter MFP subunit